MSEHSAQRKTITCHDETKPRGVRVVTYCKECGCKVLLDDNDKEVTR